MLNKFFTFKNDHAIFTGETLKCYIPKRYENRGLLTFGDIVKVLGVFEIEVFDSSLPNKSQLQGLLLPCMISTVPHNVESSIKRDIDCFVFEYKQNQPFLTTTTLLEQNKLAYLIFMEYISLGNIPAWLTYDQAAFLFDKVTKTTGANLNIDHTVFEMIYSHSFRDQENTSRKYRHTDMKKPPSFVELRSISESPDSTSSKIIGSYPIDGLNSALTDVIEDMSDLENHLRS